MGIYIKSISMPKNCFECKFIRHGMEENWCYITSNGIPCECPLIDIPVPHGRLIDVDTLIKTDNMVGKMMMFGGQYVYTESEIDNAPTVIEAEGE